LFKNVTFEFDQKEPIGINIDGKSVFDIDGMIYCQGSCLALENATIFDFIRFCQLENVSLEFTDYAIAMISKFKMKKMGFESETINAIKKKTAQKVNCKVVKNKTYIPWEEADFQIEFGKGIVQSSEIVPLAISYGIIRKCTKNKVTGVYVEFDSPLWSKDEILDKNENDLVGTLEQGDMTWIAQEITLRVKNKLGGIADTDLPILVKRLDVEFNKIKLEHEEAMKQVADLTGKSKWLEAEPFIETAFYLKPWDTYTKQRYKVVKEKCEGLRISIQPKEEDINVESTPTENE